MSSYFDSQYHDQCHGSELIVEDESTAFRIDLQFEDDLTGPSPKSLEFRTAQSAHARDSVSSSPAEMQPTSQLKRSRKRPDEIARPYRCGWDGCEKAYGRLNHLNTHIAIHRHGLRRTSSDFPSVTRKMATRMILPNLKPDYSFASNDSPGSEVSPLPTPPPTGEPRIFDGKSAGHQPFSQSHGIVCEPNPFDHHSFLTTQRLRHERARNKALAKIKDLEHRRNNIAAALAELEHQIGLEQSRFSYEHQSLEATSRELFQWDQLCHSPEVSWLQ